MPKFLKYLRIIFTAFCGIACLLLIALWVHTVHKQDKAAAWISDSYYFYGDAFQHWMEIDIAKPTPQPEPLFSMNYRRYYHSNFVANPNPLTCPVHTWHIGASGPPFAPGVEIRTPIWVPVIASAVLGILPWGSKLSRVKRFSLRTLLIATTLVAVVLGLVVVLCK